jgi:hypothetical protein
MTFHERVTAEKDLMAQPLPDARLSDPLADEGGVAGLCADALVAELAQHPVGL